MGYTPKKSFGERFRTVATVFAIASVVFKFFQMPPKDWNIFSFVTAAVSGIFGAFFYVLIERAFVKQLKREQQ